MSAGDELRRRVDDLLEEHGTTFADPDGFRVVIRHSKSPSNAKSAPKTARRTALRRS